MLTPWNREGFRDFDEISDFSRKCVIFLFKLLIFEVSTSPWNICFGKKSMLVSENTLVGLSKTVLSVSVVSLSFLAKSQVLFQDGWNAYSRRWSFLKKKGVSQQLTGYGHLVPRNFNFPKTFVGFWFSLIFNGNCFFSFFSSICIDFQWKYVLLAKNISIENQCKSKKKHQKTVSIENQNPTNIVGENFWRISGTTWS